MRPRDPARMSPADLAREQVRPLPTTMADAARRAREGRRAARGAWAACWPAAISASDARRRPRSRPVTRSSRSASTSTGSERHARSSSSATSASSTTTATPSRPAQLNDPAAFPVPTSPSRRTRRCAPVDAGSSAFYRRLLRAVWPPSTGCRPHRGGGARGARRAPARSNWSPAHLPEARRRRPGDRHRVPDAGHRRWTTPSSTRRAAQHRVTLLRLEVEFQQLVAEHDRYDDLLGAVRAALADVRGRGFAGSQEHRGLPHRLGRRALGPTTTPARRFAAARDEAARAGAVRLGHKPLLDTLLHTAFEAAAAQELPLQFHVGYGDPDADLRPCRAAGAARGAGGAGLSVDAAGPAARLLALLPRGRLPGLGLSATPGRTSPTASPSSPRPRCDR